VQWRACRSSASGRPGAQKVVGGGGKERGEHGESISGPTRARVTVWQPGDGDEVVAEVELGGGGAQARRGGKKGAGRTDGGVSLLWGAESSAGRQRTMSKEGGCRC
jgi:hypothetical protein